MSFGAKIETEPRYEDFRWLNFKILQGSEPFQPQDHIAFYPGTSELASIENVLLAGLVIKLSKTKEGLKKVGERSSQKKYQLLLLITFKLGRKRLIFC